MLKTDWFKMQRRKEKDGMKGCFRKETEEKVPIGIMFVPRTKEGKLVRMIREEERELGRTLGNTVKIVEKGGTKLCDLICPSNPWKSEDCKRKNCCICTQ